jgi:hypothetical protein
LAEKKQKSKFRKGEAVVDEDGFTLVTRGGAYGQTLGGGVRVASKKFQQAQRSGRAKKEAKEKTGFYSFQRAEKQRRGEYYLRVSRKWNRLTNGVDDRTNGAEEEMGGRQGESGETQGIEAVQTLLVMVRAHTTDTIPVVRHDKGT